MWVSTNSCAEPNFECHVGNALLEREFAGFRGPFAGSKILPSLSAAMAWRISSPSGLAVTPYALRGHKRHPRRGPLLDPHPSVYFFGGCAGAGGCSLLGGTMFFILMYVARFP
jgi:hypothetical protein